ncbi:hypothetical protein CWI38_1452p0020 [Hamiltosporidium tvaerminnensis]|uniref:Uncharacterized protein n=1 Tax=Hamiltosporidium tvaerminnensis TaxID=1176355 RepID=A0A4Q9LRD8_9MICR|nr:hypothetical protein CWI38_1452p0020 [Hamiltosporidium tvaerminnensis]
MTEEVNEQYTIRNKQREIGYKKPVTKENSRGIPRSMSFEELDYAVHALLDVNNVYTFPVKNYEEVYIKSLKEAQLAKLYNEIDKQNFIQRNIRPRNEAVFCYIQDRNVSWGAEGMCQHCKQSRKTVNHLATRYKKMLGHDYTRRHDEVIRFMHLLLLNKYKSHSVQEIFDNQIAEIRIDTRIKTGVKFRKKRLVVFVIDISKKRITLLELRKDDLLANELGLVYKFGTFETILVNRRRGFESELNAEESLERASLNVMLEAESRNNQYFFNASIKCGIMKEPTINIKGKLGFRRRNDSF